MKKIIVANWKCNPTTQVETKKMFLSLKAGLRNSKAEVVVCPPFVYLTSFALGGLGFKLGAQNCFWENSGAFTGEVSPKMLKDLGVKYVILGHSERRLVIGETTEQVNKKVKAVLKIGLIPIVCFGESLGEKQNGKSFTSVEKEIKEIMAGVSRIDIGKVIFAYESDWAIGTANNCSANDVLTISLFVKKIMSEIYGPKIGQQIKVLYGGSVNSKNAKEYLENEAIGGLLAGGASLNIKEFLGILSLV